MVVWSNVRFLWAVSRVLSKEQVLSKVGRSGRFLKEKCMFALIGHLKVKEGYGLWWETILPFFCKPTSMCVCHKWLGWFGSWSPGFMIHILGPNSLWRWTSINVFSEVLRPRRTFWNTFCKFSSSCNDGVLCCISFSHSLQTAFIWARFVCSFSFLSSTIMMVPQINASGNAHCSLRMWCYVHNWPSSLTG